jgi:GNAT superfamily N-acetyltransferase
MDTTGVRIATSAERDALVATLMLAFAGDPCTRYMFAKPEDFVAGFPALAVGMGGAAIEHGSAWLAEDCAAAALWLPPGVESDSEAMVAAITASIDEAKLPVLGEVGRAMAHFHPHEAHWYLPLVGVDPLRQGRGLGSAILQEGLRRCDADGLPAYLENSNPKNTGLYERLGFEAIGLIQPADFPPMQPMLRRPRS